MHAHVVCVSSRRKSNVVSCQRREAAAAIAIQRKQAKSEIIFSISSSLNPMLPFSCHCAQASTCSQAFPSLALSTKRFRIPKAKTTNMCVRAHQGNYCWCKVLTTDSNDDIVTGFLSGGLERKRWKEERHTNPHRREFVAVTWCGLVVPGQKLVEESRYQVGRARKSECRLGAGCAFGTRAPSRFGQGWVPGQAKKGTQVGGA